MRLKNKVALITGGNNGIGLATARLFVAEGARVVITGRNGQALDRAVAELGDSALALRSDTTDPEMCDQAVAATLERFNALDVVFANAGFGVITAVGSTSVTDFDSVLRTNVLGAFLVVQAAAPHLSAGASIILNGSVYATAGPVGLSAYAASKGALASMGRVLAAELAPRGVRVNLVVPGATRTAIWNPLAATPEAFQQLDAQLCAAIPLGRMLDPAEVAQAVLYLASDDASAVTGSELVVDGGQIGAPLGAPAYRAAG
jgi:NAD(P)-dependent dehydrogenase (short-subunit alcohol dehydrogenase family)